MESGEMNEAATMAALFLIATEGNVTVALRELYELPWSEERDEAEQAILAAYNAMAEVPL